ncbi:peptidylprolyl isomerase [Legionella israelensis]|uniref:Periplasmic chaperone PpiD n=1 Tax=Legionella israelensis TaxID=454 RepID=A0AAX1EF11_9GAMM|nr:SurA N-terminal domain-containing protein [Legionella israelensis]QBR83688.1 peptidylprolyl isomerase [Legionella israelensis]
MLQKLNERIQGLIAWLIIILIAITFTLFGVDYYLQSRQAADVKAVVNDESIKYQAFETNYRRARAQRDSAQITLEEDKRLQKNVLEQMVVNTVSVQAARKNGFEVGVEQANAAIVNIPQFQEDGRFSRERYQMALSGALFTPETFQKEVKQGMLLNQQRFAFIGTSFALPGEIRQFVRLFMQTRTYDYLLIPYALFSDKINISEEDVQNYYKKHQNQFKTKEKVSLNYIELSMKNIKADIEISDAEARRYYEENKNNYLKPAQWRVSHILFAVPEGADPEDIKKIKVKAEEAYDVLKKNPGQFSEWVKRVSDDKLSLKDDGILPWLVAGQTEYDKTLVQLTQQDQISAPVRTSYGFEIFKLLDYKPASVVSFNKVKKTIKEQLITEAAQAKYNRTLETLSDLSYQNPDSLKPVADELNLPVRSTQPFGRQGGDTSLTQNKSVINAAFSHDVLVLGNNSDPIQVDDDSVIVLRVQKHLKPVQLPLTAVKNQIETKLIKQKAIEKAKQLGEVLLTADNKTEKQLTDKYQLNWHNVIKASRETEQVNSIINNIAFSISKTDKKNGHLLSSGNYALVHLKSINDGKMTDLDKEQQKSIAQQIEASYGMTAYDLYVNSLLKKADIKRH